MHSTERNFSKTGGPARGMLASMVITHAYETLDGSGNWFELSALAGTVLGPTHPRLKAIVKNLNNNISNCRRQIEASGTPLDNVFASRIHGNSASFDPRILQLFYNRSGAKGKAGFVLFDVLADRFKTTSRQGNHDISEVVRLLNRLHAGDIDQAIDVFRGKQRADLSKNARALATALSACSQLAVFRLLNWMDHRHFEQLTQLETAYLEEALTPEAMEKPVLDDQAVVLTVEQVKALSAPAEEPRVHETKSKPKRRLRLPTKWLAVALAAALLVAASSPVIFTQPRRILAEQGVGAAYAAVRDMLTDGRVNGRQLRDAAVVLYRRGEMDSANDILLEIVGDDGYDAKLRADCYLQLGRIALVDDPQKALTYFEEADQLYALPHQRNHSALELARVHMALGDYDTARAYLSIARSLHRLHGGGNELKAWSIAGKLARYEGRFDEALVFNQMGYELCLKKGNKQGIAEFASQLGIIHALVGNAELANKYTDEAGYFYGLLSDRNGLLANQTNYILIARLEGQPPPDHITNSLIKIIEQTDDRFLLEELEYMKTVPLPTK